MTDFTPHDLARDAETLIEEAQAARVRAHVRAMLFQLSSFGDQSSDRKSEADDRKDEVDE
ncbi:hypothetical protein [Microvirga terrestris]|uniref:Phage protein n=1 Tax=Microvirga terrestris TaxID=2791024 RepID=A0ABS0HWX1_9HYPH|nr:hypothetical protein [Microvirga terrestris]MBF9198027.1 hypothetical protein [Microvirga terrestris]